MASYRSISAATVTLFGLAACSIFDVSKLPTGPVYHVPYPDEREIWEYPHQVEGSIKSIRKDGAPVFTMNEAPRKFAADGIKFPKSALTAIQNLPSNDRYDFILLLRKDGACEIERSPVSYSAELVSVKSLNGETLIDCSICPLHNKQMRRKISKIVDKSEHPGIETVTSSKFPNAGILFPPCDPIWHFIVWGCSECSSGWEKKYAEIKYW